MIRYFPVLIFSVALLSCVCNRTQDNHESILRDYIEALNAYDFSKCSYFIHDSIIQTEGQYVISDGKPGFYTIFQWDSVFSPRYEIRHMEKSDRGLEVTISKECKRIRFLHDSATVYRTLFEFQGKQIIKISGLENIYFDEKKWITRRDTLVCWIDKYHPELSGFVYDQTIQGAQNYLRAIELYNTSKNSWVIIR